MTKVSGGNTTSYGWDAVNRMIESGPLTGSRHHYTYRADGMRVRKEIPGLVEKVYYDGQMPVETFEDFSTGNDKLTRNFVGARGIEMMETTQNSATTQAYPLYDTHGNMVATLSKNTAGTSWSLGNERSYDVWGSVRAGAATGGPKGRYVANLGHVQDDESGLIYMRARYYEPESGRFLSEDPAMDGSNWFGYSSNNPSNRADFNGRNDFSITSVMTGSSLSEGLDLEVNAPGVQVIAEVSSVGDKTLRLYVGMVQGTGNGSIGIGQVLGWARQSSASAGFTKILIEGHSRFGGRGFDVFIQRALQEINRM